MWSRNRANLYIRDAMADFHPDPKAFLSPPRQGSMYRQKLECTHLIGFGSGAAGGVTPFADVTSWSFDGVDGELNIPDHADWTLGGGTGNFCVETWINYPGVGECYIFNQMVSNNDRWFFYSPGSREISLYCIVDGSTQINCGGTGTAGSYEADTWTHIAGIRGWNGNANDFAVTCNGVAVDTDTADISIGSFAAQLKMAERGSDSSWAEVRFDELRISNVARWTADFSTPTEQYTSDANTSLLIHGSEAVGGGTFTDSGNTGHTVSVLGGATQDTIVYR